jgi:hypothetical protein
MCVMNFKNITTSQTVLHKPTTSRWWFWISLVICLSLLQEATTFAPHPSLSTGTSSASRLCMAENNPFNQVKSSFLETFGMGKPKFLEPRLTRTIEDPSPSIFEEDDGVKGFASFLPSFGGFGGKPNDEAAPIPVPTSTNSDDKNKFGMAQRLESIKCVAIGAISGGIAVAPVAYYHYLGNLAQWEFTTDVSSLQAALFAIVYRYAVREDENPMLNSGVVGAFVLVRTLSNIGVSKTCSAIPLQCEYLYCNCYRNRNRDVCVLVLLLSRRS